MPTVSIYLSEDVFLDVTKIAEERDISVSKVLASSFRSPIKKEVAEYVDAFTKFEERLDRIEKKLRSLPGILKGLSEITSELIDHHKPSELESANYDHKDLVTEIPLTSPGPIIVDAATENTASEMIDSEVLERAQEKLEAVRAERKVETAKGPVKANAAMEGFFSPQPKAKWKEK